MAAAAIATAAYLVMESWFGRPIAVLLAAAFLLIGVSTMGIWNARYYAQNLEERTVPANLEDRASFLMRVYPLVESVRVAELLDRLEIDSRHQDATSTYQGAVELLGVEIAAYVARSRRRKATYREAFRFARVAMAVVAIAAPAAIAIGGVTDFAVGVTATGLAGLGLRSWLPSILESRRPDHEQIADALEEEYSRLVRQLDPYSEPRGSSRLRLFMMRIEHVEFRARPHR